MTDIKQAWRTLFKHLFDDTGTGGLIAIAGGCLHVCPYQPRQKMPVEWQGFSIVWHDPGCGCSMLENRCHGTKAGKDGA